jgi:hypothetical protein
MVIIIAIKMIASVREWKLLFYVMEEHRPRVFEK